MPTYRLGKARVADRAVVRHSLRRDGLRFGLHYNKQLRLQHERKDMVNHPPHYNQGGIECIKYLEDNLGGDGFAYYCEERYLHRWRYICYPEKQVEDLRKAAWYLGKLIESQYLPGER